ncbi:hypothetical protein GCM10022206_15650 [Streptomyces chiangmaiensis]
MEQAGSSSMEPDHCRPVATVHLHPCHIPHMPRLPHGEATSLPLEFPLATQVVPAPPPTRDAVRERRFRGV